MDHFGGPSIKSPTPPSQMATMQSTMNDICPSSNITCMQLSSLNKNPTTHANPHVSSDTSALSPFLIVLLMSPSSAQESSFQTPTDPDFVFTLPHLIAPNMHQCFQDLESEFHQEEVKEIPRRFFQFSTLTATSRFSYRSLQSHSQIPHMDPNEYRNPHSSSTKIIAWNC